MTTRIAWFLLPFAFVAACEGFGADDPPSAGPADAGRGDSAAQNNGEAGVDPIDAAAIDGADASPPCDPRGVFKEPLIQRSLGGLGQDAHPSLTGDELQVFLSAEVAKDSFRLFTASRGARTVDFGARTQVAELGTSNVALPGVSPDGRRLVFSNAVSKTDFDISEITRVNANGAFGKPSELTTLNTKSAERSPAYSADGQRIYFSSNRPTGAATNAANTDCIYVAVGANGVYGTPAAIIDSVTKLPVVGYNPVPSADGTLLYFDRVGATGASHILVGDLSQDASLLSNVTPIATAKGTGFFGANDDLEAPGYISPDNCRLYFTGGPVATTEIWMASRR